MRLEGARAGKPARPALASQATPSELVGVLALPGFDPWRKPVNRTGVRSGDRKRRTAAGPEGKVQRERAEGFG